MFFFFCVALPLPAFPLRNFPRVVFHQATHASLFFDPTGGPWRPSAALPPPSLFPSFYPTSRSSVHGTRSLGFRFASLLFPTNVAPSSGGSKASLPLFFFPKGDPPCPLSTVDRTVLSSALFPFRPSTGPSFSDLPGTEDGSPLSLPSLPRRPGGCSPPFLHNSTTFFASTAQPPLLPPWPPCSVRAPVPSPLHSHRTEPPTVFRRRPCFLCLFFGLAWNTASGRFTPCRPRVGQLRTTAFV